MSPTTQRVCTHTRGPGTTVCLRCRQEERVEARAAFRRMLLRAIALGVVIATIVIGVGSGAMVWQRRQQADASASQPSATTSSPGSVDSGVTGTSPVQAPPPAVRPDTTAPVATPAVQQGTSADSGALAAKSADATVAARSRDPAVGMGRTELGDGVFVMRTVKEVRVSFDTDGWRTRRRDKFETMLKKTLPAVYGAGVASAVAALPPAFLATAGDLMTVLPSTGARIPLGDGRTIVVWPETRQGRDGPLVVSYRSTLEARRN